MNEKVFLILGDGMRSDSLEACGHPFPKKLIDEGISYLDAKSLVPTVTLPCHLSLFYSVPPETHGILANTFVPQARKTDGIFEQIHKAGKKAAVFHGWEKFRDISQIGMLAYSCFISESKYKFVSPVLIDKAIKFAKERSPDFIFINIGEPDIAGHNYGHMAEEYLKAVYNTWSYIEKVYNEVGKDYSIIITADHGGHDRTHGTDMIEDLTIPIIIKTPFKSSKQVEKANIIDITPTIATLMGIEKSVDWEGRSII